MPITTVFHTTDDTEFSTLAAALVHEYTTGALSIRACVAPGALTETHMGDAVISKNVAGNVIITFSDTSYIEIDNRVINVYDASLVHIATYNRDQAE